MSELRRLKSPEGTIDIDERFWPVVIVTWRGNNDVSAVREFFAWNESILPRARAEGGYLMITDADGAQRPPPEVRRLVAELNDALPDETKELSIGNYVVITSALVRGAMTAMQWVSRTEWKSTQVASMREAITRAREDLARAGKEVPAGFDPDAYRAPAA